MSAKENNRNELQFIIDHMSDESVEMLLIELRGHNAQNTESKCNKHIVSNNEERVTVCCATCKHQRKYGEDSACNKCFQNYNKWEAIN